MRANMGVIAIYKSHNAIITNELNQFIFYFALIANLNNATFM